MNPSGGARNRPRNKSVLAQSENELNQNFAGGNEFCLTHFQRSFARVKGSASRGPIRTWKKWILVLLVALLLIPAMQVAVVRFVNPPLTLPMLIDQGSAMFSKTGKPPLRYHWIALPQIPEMFLEHL